MKTTCLCLAISGFLMLPISSRAQEIFDAIRKNDSKKVIELLEKDSSQVNLKDELGNTPLHLALNNGKEEISKLLVERGSDIHARNSFLETPLHKAVDKNNLPMTDFLIARGAVPEDRDKDGQTPFMLAARNTGNVEIGMVLIRNGADKNAPDKYQYMPLNWSAYFNNKEFTDFLLDQGADFDTTSGKDFHMLYFAARDGSARLFRAVSEKCTNLLAGENRKNFIMSQAISGGSVDIVNKLVAMNIPIKAETNAIGWTPVHYCAKNGYADMIELLAKKGADINLRTPSGKSAYNLADENNHKDMLPLIVKLGGNTGPQLFPDLSGPYLGQAPPGSNSKIFAPDIVSPNHCSITISPDGKEICWATDSYIMMSRLQNSTWTKPDTVPFSKVKNEGSLDDVPFITPDGRKMFFTSTRPIGSDSTGKENIWYSVKTAAGWSKPEPAGEEVNGMLLHWQVSVSDSGTLYFGGIGKDYYGGNGDIYFSRLVNGKYEKPLNIGPGINCDALEGMPYIAPDESYILFSRQTISGSMSYNGFCISFRGNDGEWLTPVSLEKYTPEGVCPSVSPDGKYFFFMSNGGTVHWMDAKFIDELRPVKKENKPESSKYTKSKEVESITVGELRDHVLFLASDAMNGRETGSGEYLKAAGYAAGHFVQAGIIPPDTVKKGEAAYYQDVPYRIINNTDGRLPVILLGGKGLGYASGLNFKVTINEDPKNVKNILPVVFVGHGVSAPQYGWDDFKGLDIKGKAVIVLNREAPGKWVRKIPRDERERLMDFNRNISQRKAAAIIVINELDWILKTWKNSRGLNSRSMMLDDPGQWQQNGPLSTQQLYLKREMAFPLFENQPYNPVPGDRPGENEYQTFELNGVFLDTADYSNETAIFSPNVVGLVKGTDTRLKNQYVVLGAHLDHIGHGNNGADDNASGSAGVMEIAEALAMAPPKRSVLVVLFSGEEKGLLGSRYFIENCPVPEDSITGMINLDMIGRTAGKYAVERTHFIAGLGETGAKMLACVEEVNSNTLQWPLKRLTREEGNPAGSDHSRFANKGIPAVFFFSGEHPDLHEPTDDPEKIDYEKMQAISQLAYEVVKHLATK